MLSQFPDQHILVDVGFVELSPKLFVQCRKTLTVCDHRIDRLILDFLCRLKFGGIFGQDLDTLLRVLVIVIPAIDDAANQPHDNDRQINLDHYPR